MYSNRVHACIVSCRSFAWSNSVRLILNRQDSWFLDCDTIWLRPCPIPSKSGHVFGSMPAGSTLPYKDPKRFWRHAWLRNPNEAVWLSVPFRFPTGSPVLADVLKVASAKLQNGFRSMPYLLFMNTVKASLQAQVLESKCRPTTEQYGIACCQRVVLLVIV